MKKGITVESSFDDYREVYTVIKKNGRLTVEEIQEALSDVGIEGYVTIVLHVGQMLDDGWTDPNEKKGDACSTFLIMEGNDCPVCRKMSTLRQYCPECGRILQGYNEVMS